jgi:hypothetical protein
MYLQAKTTGLKTLIKQITIEVCGTETLSLASSSTYKVSRPPKSGSAYEISTTVSSGWFTMTPIVSTSECEVSLYELYSDTTATTAWTNSAIKQDNTEAAVGYNYNIKVDESSAFAPTDVYLKATTTGIVSKIKHLQIEVCGLETLALDEDTPYT